MEDLFSILEKIDELRSKICAQCIKTNLFTQKKRRDIYMKSSHSIAISNQTHKETKK